MRLIIAAVLFVMAAAVNAQVTTSGISGKVTDAQNEDVIGASVKAVHVPSGTTYLGVSNDKGLFTLQGLRVGGPYTVEISYIGYKGKKFSGIQLALGQKTELNVVLEEGSEVLDEVVVSGSRNSNMSTSRAGAVTSVDANKIASIPTVSRSLNDILKLTPQGGNTGNGFAVGGGNYRQSYVTVDGAAFNNAFGIGSNLPGGGSPISLDALEQMSVSTSPFDVRQSGFTGAAINAVTKSGTNQFKGSAYMYNTNVHLRGNKVDDYELTRNRAHTTTYGVTLGGPIIKDKLFFFVNGEYEANVTAGPSGTARASESDSWSVSTGTVHRPTVAGMDEIASYLQSQYGYNPGRYQGYSLDTPAYKILARLDWNINDYNHLNFRFSRSHSKDSNTPSSSTSPLKDSSIYPGGEDASAGKSQSGRTANAGLYFESSRYMQERNFTSFAAEWTSKWGIVNNALRLTYSYQDEPRTYEGGVFPTVDILKNGSLYASFGPDPFTAGNLRQVKTFVATDEASWAIGKHNLLAGLSYETNKATNGFCQAGNGYYVYSSFEDFKNGAKPAAYGVTFPMDGSDQFLATMKQNQFSLYLQDQMNLSDNFRLTAGLRFELPIYPSLENNYNEAFAKIDFNGANWTKGSDGKYTQISESAAKHYYTDQLPSNSLTVSPRVGFNWDLTGERKYVLRGGTGYFVGRLPFVWLVSAVGNSGCGQYTYYYNTQSAAEYGQPNFHTTVADQIKDLSIQTSVAAPSAPTIIDKDLKMNATWKSSLAFDAKLPYDIDFSLEGIYSREFNPAIVTNEGYYYDGTSTITLAPNDTRRYYTLIPKQANTYQNAYLITNAGHKAYYYSITASLAKKFNFGLDLSASYTYSHARSYGDGIGDQVSSAYYNNRYSVNGNNEKELGYGTYVTPNRLLITATYYKEYAKNLATRVGLVYEGMNMGYAGGYGSTRYSYTLTSNVVNDYGSNGLIYVPATRDELKDWNFVAYKYNDANGTKQEYSADDQRDDFWNYINQDSYLKNRKGKYAERGGAVMPWHHQLDFKFEQSVFLKVGGQRNTLQFGVDIKNLANLLNSGWGLYKTVNNYSILKYNKGAFNFQRNGTEVLKTTYSNYTSFNSTYSIQFSIRYIFN